MAAETTTHTILTGETRASFVSFSGDVFSRGYLLRDGAQFAICTLIASRLLVNDGVRKIRSLPQGQPSSRTCPHND